MNNKYICPKCGNKEYNSGKLRIPGSRLAQLMNMRFRKFTVVTCKNCLYTELYACSNSNIDEILEKAYSDRKPKY